MPHAIIDLSGMRFNKLVVLKQEGRNNQNKPLWLCKCDCGNLTHVSRRRLIKGYTKSCGCFQRELARIRLTTHGLSKINGKHTRLYRIWCGAKDRCCNPKSKYWERYGKRGITFCEEWKHDYKAFYLWAMAKGYDDSLTLDRIDNDKGYFPDNCRWASYETQENNRSNNILFKIDGVTITLAQLARKEGVTRNVAEKNHKEERFYGNI